MSINLWDKDDPFKIQQFCADAGNYNGNPFGPIQTTFEIPNNLFDSIFTYDGGFVVGLTHSKQIAYYNPLNGNATVFSAVKNIDKILYVSHARRSFLPTVFFESNGSKFMISHNANLFYTKIDDYISETILFAQILTTDNLLIISRDLNNDNRSIQATLYYNLDSFATFQVSYNVIQFSEPFPWIEPCSFYFPTSYQTGSSTLDQFSMNIVCNGTTQDGYFVSLAYFLSVETLEISMGFSKTNFGPNLMPFVFTVDRNSTFVTIDANSGDGIELKVASDMDDPFQDYGELIEISHLTGPMNAVYIDSISMWAASNSSMTVFSAPVSPYWCGVQYAFSGDVEIEMDFQWTNNTLNATNIQYYVVNITWFQLQSKNSTDDIDLSSSYFVCTECEAYNPQTDSECAGHGQCILTWNSQQFPTCACYLGWSGDYCSDFRDDYAILAISLGISMISLLLCFCVGMICNRKAETINEASVLSHERKDVAKRREIYGVDKNSPLFGIACSGGG